MLVLTDSALYSLAGDGQTGAPSVLYEGGDACQCSEGLYLNVLGMQDGTILVVGRDGMRSIPAGVAREITSLAILSEDPLRLLIGAEPPHVFNLNGTGAAVRNGSFAGLPVREHWYTPWGGPAAVRSLACTGDGWVYADVHVGSIMRSADMGQSWEPVTPQLHVDVHQVSTCPADDSRVYAQTADAFWISHDRGTSWEHRADDLGGRYGRCVTVHPGNPDLILATVSDGPHGDDVRGQLYRSEDAGLHWTHVASGFPSSTHENIDTFHVAFSPEGSAWAVVDTGLYFGGPAAREWSLFWEAPDPIRMLSCRRP